MNLAKQISLSILTVLLIVSFYLVIEDGPGSSLTGYVTADVNEEQNVGYKTQALYLTGAVIIFLLVAYLILIYPEKE